jgi:LysR family transcriptional regulator, hydrogen peroxide-inducible genes activator
MNLQQLEYILAVDRFRHFSRAADSCHVTQATLSAMVKKLEEELGVVIFDRKSSPVIPTEKGRAVLLAARQVLQQTQALRDIARNQVPLIAGNVRIGVIPTIAGSLLPKLVNPLTQRFPELNPVFLELTTAEVIKQLKEGQLDIGIAATPLRDKDIEENIVYYEALLVYGEQEQIQRQYIAPEEISQRSVWMLEEGHCLRNQIMQICNLKPHSGEQKINFQANSFETLLNMVDALGGLTLIPEIYCQELCERRKSRLRHFQSPVPVREVALLTYRPYAREQLSSALKEIILENLPGNLRTASLKKSELIIAEPL